MKWETLKQRVAAEVRTSIMNGADYWRYKEGASEPGWIAALRMSIAERRKWRDCIPELADAAYNRIMAWDVRCVGTLRELFPDAFPKSLRQGHLLAYMQDSKDNPWVVEVVR